MSRTVLGTVGSARRAAVDHKGLVTPAPASWTLDWHVGADDRWHRPQEEAAVRQHLLGPAPVVETAMRVPGGDAVHRVYAAAPDHLVVEVENRSAVPFALALVFPSAVEVDGTEVSVGGKPALRLARAASPLSAEMGPEAVMVPVAHRTTFRCAVAMGKVRRVVEPSLLPSAADVVAGWQALLRHGMTVELPDEVLQQRIDTARALLMLFDDGDRVTPDPLGGTRDRADVAAVLAARSQWGLDVHSAELRRPRRLPSPQPAPSLDPPRLDHGGEVGRFLLAARDLFVRERPDGSVELLPEAFPGLHGAPVEVHGGPVSFALRWHGERPALLWDSREPRRITCPGLDPSWSTEEQQGEALLGNAAATAGGPATGP